MTISIIKPNWPIQNNVNAFVTTRAGGVSKSPYNSFNLALHVNDNSDHVKSNRHKLVKYFPEQTQIKWLKQTHSHKVVDAAGIEPDVIEADAAYTTSKNVACAVLTADCLPILLADKNGECVAAVHAGWRGILNGVITNTINAMKLSAQPEYAWLGPAIGSKAFEVGHDVFEAYMQSNQAFEDCFIVKNLAYGNSEKWSLDIYKAAKVVLTAADIDNVFGGEYCTYTDTDQFFSYRRQAVTGRMATIIARR